MTIHHALTVINMANASRNLDSVSVTMDTAVYNVIFSLVLVIVMEMVSVSLVLQRRMVVVMFASVERAGLD